MIQRLSTVLVPLIALQLLPLSEASHFRFGHISFAPTDSSNNTIKFVFRLAFRRSYSSYYCDQSIISRGSLLGSGNSWNAACLNYYGSYSQCNSRAIGNTGFKCTDYSSVEDWSMGENNFTYSFSSIHDEWRVSYSSCCWIYLSRGGSGSWLVTAIVNLTRRADTGRINSSPVSRSPAIVRWRQGCPQSLRIPVEDPDGDAVRCRWANYTESYRYPDSFPYGTLDEASCTMFYNGTIGTTGTYATAITIEDFPAGTTDFSSLSPFSAVGLQFLVIISSQHGSCNEVPVFTGSTPNDGECSEVQIGSAYKAVIEVESSDVSVQIVEIVTSSPSGMQLSPLYYYGGVYYRNITWYPGQYQVGQQSFCFKAVDSNNMESEYRCVTILVGLSNTPRVIMGSRMPGNPLSIRGPSFLWWSIQFDRVIKKPRFSSYIRLVLLPSGQTVYKVDTLSVYVTISSDQLTLLFAFPYAAISMSGSYAILIDPGAVVGQGCSYDGPPTPGITSTSGWQFNPNGYCPAGYYLAPPSFTYCVDIDECASYSGSMPMSISATPAYILPTASSSLSPSFYSLPFPWDFQLHLPSGCDHNCANTIGNFSCSCVSGYRLDSDGKSCMDINECSINNGGCSHQCYNFPGSFYCGCPEGTTMAANNLTCVQPGVTVTCTETNMTVSMEKQTFPYFTVNNLRLRYSSCRATENSTHLVISTLLNGCGTLVNETQENIMFWNEIRVDAVVIDYVITRTHDINLPFYCSFSRRRFLAISFQPLNIVHEIEGGYGNFTFRMDFYKSALYATPHSNYPIQMGLDEYLYVEYSVESSAELVIMAENCRATKYESYYSWPYYNIIRNGCPTDTTLDYSYNPKASLQRFKFKTFRFFDDYDTVIFHCEVLACHLNGNNTRCRKSCLSSKRRKRRDVTGNNEDKGNEESTKTHILSTGPIVIKKIETADTGKNKQEVALIGGAAGAGAVGLIAIIALAVLFVKYRIARRLMNRNKIGDMYATQEEQMSRKNAYIQEDDMIEKNESL